MTAAQQLLQTAPCEGASSTRPQAAHSGASKTDTSASAVIRSTRPASAACRPYADRARDSSSTRMASASPHKRSSE